MNRKFNEKHLFIKCIKAFSRNIINVFTVTFDQLNAYFIKAKHYRQKQCFLCISQFRDFSIFGFS